MKKANALFGIKAGVSWKGKVYSSKTKECYDSINYTIITDLFRAYSSVDECVADYFALLSGADRYKNLIGEKDYKTACRKIQEDGYATAPNYTTALISLIETYSLTAYDTYNINTNTTQPANSIKVGQSVKILPSAVQYTTGQTIPARLKGATDEVLQISRDGKSVLLKSVYSWFWVKDVERICL
ncbi:MAG: glucosaminidase domain-containing protein [Oscillospiraceae bacterium]|nr:glucosaminidase domain-containing protein [Oscillospiraceae bacterium]